MSIDNRSGIFGIVGIVCWRVLLILDRSGIFGIVGIVCWRVPLILDRSGIYGIVGIVGESHLSQKLGIVR